MTSPPFRRPPRARRARPAPPPLPDRLGLVCAGGGVTGAVYEIGTLAALEDRLENATLRDFDVYVGVSAGAYVGALVANGVSPGVMYRNVTRSGGLRTDLDDLALFRLNFGEIARRLATAPFAVLDAAWDYYKNRHETTLTDLVSSLGELLPSGIFRNEGLETWLARNLSHAGRTNDFRRLEKALRIVAVALDTGETTTFGAPGHDAVPISKAVQASSAVPGLYRPVTIDGTEYIDGGVRKTAHISLALKERCGFVLCVNPIVPIRYSHAPRVLPRANGGGALSSRGLPTILDQVFRVTLHARMRYGLDRYRREHPDVDILVFEPRPEDLPRFMTHHIMRTSGRARIAEYAYLSTMRTLDADFARLSRVFLRHGLVLRPPVPAKEYASRRAARAAAADGPDAPTRLAASLEVLERDLPRVERLRRLKLVR